METRSRRAWIFAAALLFVASTTPTAQAAVITVELAWTHQKAKIIDNSVMLQTDLGFNVVLTKGYLTTFALTLLPCKQENGNWIRRFAGQALAQLSPIRPANAGHGQGLLANQLRQSIVENLLTRAPVRLGSFEPPEDTYCQVHYLTGHAILRTQRLPRDVSMVGASLHLQGAYKRRSDSQSTPFTIRTKEAFGEYAPRRPGTSVLLKFDRQGPMRVQIVRDLDSLFDGLDFTRLKKDLWGRHVLRNITSSLNVSVGPPMPH